LYQGPLVIGNRCVVLERPWDTLDAGVDITPKVKRNRCFKIAAQDLAAFSCRKDVWPGANGLFRAFDGCGYVHDKVRAAGSYCYCMSWFRWVRPPITPDYASDALLHDFSLWYSELGKDPRPMFETLRGIEFSDAVAKFREVNDTWKLAPIKGPAPGVKLISCVIMTDGCSASLMECLESFRRQTYPFLELLVVNRDPSKELSVRMPRSKVINLRNFALQDLLRSTNGGHILFWPRNTVAYPSKVSQMVQELENGFSWAESSALISREVLGAANQGYNVEDLIREYGTKSNEVRHPVDLESSASGGTGLTEAVPRWFKHYEQTVVASATVKFSKQVPLFLMMWNLVTWPLKIINDLAGLDKFNVVLVDQGSVYEPLQFFYRSYDDPLRLLPEPLCRFDFLRSPIISAFCRRGDPFVVCDPDIDISELPADTADILFDAMRKSGSYAAGIGCKKFGPSRFWDKPGGGARFPFTMYRNNAGFRGVPQCEVALPITHMPSTIDVAAGLSEELMFYLEKRFERVRAANPDLLEAYKRLIDKSRDD